MSDNCKSCPELNHQIKSLEQTIAKQQKVIDELERRHQILFEDGPLNYQSLDGNGCFVDVNRKWLATGGYSKDEVIGKRFDQFLTPDSREIFLKNFPKFKASGKVSGVEFEILKKDGSTAVMNLVGAVGYDHDSQFTRTHCLMQDLTSELESLKKFNSFFYLNPCPMTVTSLPERTFLEVNEAFLSTLGYSREEVIGKSSQDLGLFVDQAAIAQMVDKMRTTGSVKKMEMRVRSKDGQLLYGLFSGESINIRGKQYFLSAMLGITELKRLERELRQSEEKFRLITETSPSWIWSFDSQAFFTYSNPAVNDVLGYHPDEIVGSSAFDLIHANDHLRIRRLLDDCLKYRRGWKNIEIRYLHKDGSVITFESSGSPIVGRDGQVEGFSAVDRDVSERNLAQEKARKANQFLKLIVETISLPIGLSSGALQQADYLNPKWSSLFGYTRDDMPTVSDWWPLAYPDEDYRSQVALEWNRRVKQAILNRSEIEPMVTTVRCKDGFDRIIEWHVISTGEWNVVHGVDLTEHKRLEKELRLSEEKYRQLTETAPDWIWEIDLDGKVLYSNPSAKQLTGYTSEELTGRMASDFIHHDNIEDLKKLIHNCIIQRSGWHNHEGYWIHKDGSIRVFEAGAVPLLDENNKVIAFRGIARDISERKKLETERLQVQQQLLHNQKLESLSIMAGGIAHDFNNILMGIMGNLELTLDQENFDQKTRRQIETAMLGAERAAKLSGQMLVYSGCQLFLPKNVCLRKLLVDLKPELQKVVSQTTTLIYDISDDFLQIRGEANKVQRLITNLVVNGSEALGDIPGTVSVSVSQIECDQTILSQSVLEEKPSPGSFISITVSDTGCGMEAETLQKLFDPFFTTKFWGRGLGMPEIIGVVRSHGGAIIVQSSVGHGSRIQVLFPKAKEDTITPEGIITPQADESATHPSQRKTVLVVDDEDLVRSMITDRLDLLGYDTIVAVDGEQCIREFKTHIDRIDLVLLDFMMPGMNGVEVFEELITVEPNVKVILSTGYATEEVTSMFSGRKPDAVIHKPYSLQDLKEELNRIFQKQALN